MALLAKIVRAQALGFSHSGQHRFAAQAHILCPMAAGTGQTVAPARREDRIAVRRLRPWLRPMQARPQLQLHSFQVQVSGLVSPGQRCGLAVGLFSLQFPDGPEQPFFSVASSRCLLLPSDEGHKLLVDLHQLLAQALEALEFRHLLLGYVQRRRSGETLIDLLPFTLRLMRNCGSCPGSLGLAQWHVGFSTEAHAGGNGTGSKNYPS